MTGAHWGTFNDYAPIFEWVVLILICVTLVFDEGVHKLGHWLEQKAGKHHDEKMKITNIHAMYSALLACARVPVAL